MLDSMQYEDYVLATNLMKVLQASKYFPVTFVLRLCISTDIHEFLSSFATYGVGDALHSIFYSQSFSA